MNDTTEDEEDEDELTRDTIIAGYDGRTLFAVMTATNLASR